MRPRFQPPALGAAARHARRVHDAVRRRHARQLMGEASTTYLLSRTAAPAIAELRPDARIIAILREPASFLRSLHLQLLSTHVESAKTLRRAIALEPARREGATSRGTHTALSCSCTPTTSATWSTCSAIARRSRRSRSSCSSTTTSSRDNEGTVRSGARLPRRRGDGAGEPQRSQPDSHSMRSQNLDELRERDLRRQRARFARRQGRRSRCSPRASLRTRGDAGDPPPPSSTAAPAPADEQLMLELRSRFHGEVERLGEYLDRDLVSLWGYDSLAEAMFAPAPQAARRPAGASAPTPRQVAALPPRAPSPSPARPRWTSAGSDATARRSSTRSGEADDSAYVHLPVERRTAVGRGLERRPADAPPPACAARGRRGAGSPRAFAPAPSSSSSTPTPPAACPRRST